MIGSKKLSLLLALGVLVLCFCGCTTQKAQATTDPPAAVISVTDQPATPSAYLGILEDYATLVNYRLSDTFEEDWNSRDALQGEHIYQALQDSKNERETYGVSLYTRWSNMIVEMTAGLTGRDATSFGYFLMDVNGDLIPELFWVRQDFTILALFTVCDEAAVLLDAFSPGHTCVIADNGDFLTFSSGGAADFSYSIRRLDEWGKFNEVLRFGCESSGFDQPQYYKTENQITTVLTEAEFIALQNRYPISHGENYEEWNIYCLR